VVGVVVVCGVGCWGGVFLGVGGGGLLNQLKLWIRLLSKKLRCKKREETNCLFLNLYRLQVYRKKTARMKDSGGRARLTKKRKEHSFITKGEAYLFHDEERCALAEKVKIRC